MINESFQFDGILLTLISLALCVVVVIAHRWTKKIAKYYWFWLAISVFFLTYIIAISWHRYWGLFASGEAYKMPELEFKTAVSYAFCTNICFFVSFAIPVALICDPTRKVAQAFSPLAIFASIIVLFVTFPMGQNSPKLTWEFIFIGHLGNQPWDPDCYYFEHIFNMLLGIGVLLNTPKFGWKGIIRQFIAFGVMYAWIGIVMGFTGSDHYVSGLSQWDFVDGHFGMLTKALGLNGAQGQIVFFCVFPVILFLLCMLNDAVKRGWYKYGNYSTHNWIKWYNYNQYTVNKLI